MGDLKTFIKECLLSHRECNSFHFFPLPQRFPQCGLIWSFDINLYWCINDSLLSFGCINVRRWPLNKACIYKCITETADLLCAVLTGITSLLLVKCAPSLNNINDTLQAAGGPSCLKPLKTLNQRAEKVVRLVWRDSNQRCNDGSNLWSWIGDVGVNSGCLHMEENTKQKNSLWYFWSPLMSMFVSLIGYKVPTSPVGRWSKWQSLSRAFAIMITWSSFVPSVLLYYLTPALDLQSLQWLNKLQALMQDFCLSAASCGSAQNYNNMQSKM